MKSCQTQVVRVCPIFVAPIFLALILLTTIFSTALPSFAQSMVPSFGQRATFGFDLGASTDRFGGLPQNTGLIGDINVQYAILQGDPKKDTPAVIAGGEIRFPTNASYQSTEFAVFGSLAFHFTSSFTAGFRGQLRRILVPPSTVNGQIFNRDDMTLLEIPVFIQYKFGPAKRAFVEAQGTPEFNPHYRASVATPPPIPNPNLDHAYDIRGSLGYTFGKWYAKATYGTRYFKFVYNTGNPNYLYNWRSDIVTAGVGVIF
jgi:hypothetical protein